jgi:hypothetical protein
MHARISHTKQYTQTVNTLDKIHTKSLKRHEHIANKRRETRITRTKQFTHVFQTLYKIHI